MNPELLDKIKALAHSDRGWVMSEARKLTERLQKHPKDEILFETGYGPSGLPHIGTFAEVFRTTMVRYGFSLISDVPTRLICFSDDMDGLRKVPDNVPNAEMLTEHLHKPLCEVPDPFGCHASFAEHNNSLLRRFLDSFGFDYEFVSSFETYRSGRFNAMLLRLLEKYDEVMEVMLPTLGAERRATYSPFLPICAETGHVLQVPVVERNANEGTLVYERADGEKVETSVVDGHCKLQWKPDWGMRWVALGVDYEMSGKDLSESVILSAKIARILGGVAPEGFSYELFLDEAGQKISKSKGNGLSIEDWLRYAPAESLSYFMYGKPGSAKRLYFDVIPKAVDECLSHLAAVDTEDASDDNAEKLLKNPLFFIRKGDVERETLPVSFSLLLTLVNAGSITDAETLRGFVARYGGDADRGSPLLDELMGYALRYYEDFIKPHKQYTPLQGSDRAAVMRLYEELDKGYVEDSEALQKIIFDVGREAGYESSMGDWFLALYKGLLGQDKGPRFGTLLAILGKERALGMVVSALGRTSTKLLPSLSMEEVAFWKRIAEQGKDFAQYILGSIYFFGDGVQQDKKEAFKWLYSAAEQGYAPAQYGLGAYYIGVTKDYNEAYKWFHLAAKQENKHAQLLLGMMYEKGHGVKKSYSEARKWYSKAEKQGLTEAQEALARIYGRGGRGIMKDPIKAKAWSEKAKAQGVLQNNNERLAPLDEMLASLDMVAQQAALANLEIIPRA